MYGNLNLATPPPFPKTINPRYYIVPPVIQNALLICYLYSINTTICKGNSWISGKNTHLKNFLLTMNYAQKDDIFFPFFIKVVVNKSKAYSFLIIGMMHLQKLLLSVIMLRFHFSLLGRALEYIKTTEVL